MAEEWIECIPCTCSHPPKDHDIMGCKHQYLSDPPCDCVGVFGIIGGHPPGTEPK